MHVCCLFLLNDPTDSFYPQVKRHAIDHAPTVEAHEISLDRTFDRLPHRRPATTINLRFTGLDRHFLRLESLLLGILHCLVFEIVEHLVGFALDRIHLFLRLVSRSWSEVFLAQSPPEVSVRWPSEAVSGHFISLTEVERGTNIVLNEHFWRR